MTEQIVIEIDANIMNNVVAYLSEKPYKEVVNLINDIQVKAKIKEQQDEPKKKAPVKKPKA